MKLNKIIFMLACTLLTLAGCDKYLDMKPDQKMLVPKTLADCDALLDNRSTMNSSFSPIPDIASDHYYLNAANFNAIANSEDRNAHVWNPMTELATNHWQAPYKVVLIANQVLTLLKDIDRNTNPTDYDRIKGEGLFFRAYSWMQLLNVFTVGYDAAKAKDILGLVLRLNPDIDYIESRSSLEDSYQQIKKDLEEAVPLLPEKIVIKTRPTKAAALATLARLGLMMGDYGVAEKRAREALDLYAVLIDYNTLSKTASAPFVRFNDEVIFHAVTFTNACINPTIAKIDSNLIKSYKNNDLRRTLYFKSNNNGTYAFKGRYDGAVNASTFCGIATDELYLTLSEALVRNNKVTDAIGYLNKLLRSRYVKNTYLDFSSGDRELVLKEVLAERNKSLIMRNLRWMDMKRLNHDIRFQQTFRRLIDNVVYSIEPNDLRYAFLIPKKVIEFNPLIQQNQR
ncbi:MULTISPECIES: RagB/SusD family nutrient uptake outer membrane protein [Sphingobacterium]|uniref:SusD-like starch-binding protein associating with outer membrane n=1 Tax=Sphingobacterium siyangense TaxID=459529 RepID=A0A562MG78_9SPHI|nr:MULTISPECIES: RagB/SusD family nutrient uptake outer membrane protein [Sphingobacterium]TWI18900.1 SusD-like starch-binding protein associating with outer membrane [Sphingobacterium siyangense]